MRAASTFFNVNIRHHTPDTCMYRRTCASRKGWDQMRPFAVVNTLFVGDLWQIPPVGQVAIMGNPFGKAALESSRAAGGVNMFWKTPSIR